MRPCHILVKQVSPDVLLGQNTRGSRSDMRPVQRDRSSVDINGTMENPPAANAEAGLTLRVMWGQGEEEVKTKIQEVNSRCVGHQLVG